MKRATTTTIHLRGRDARNFMRAVSESVSGAEADEDKRHAPLVMALVAERSALLDRTEKAEAERDALARKFADVSDKMSGGNSPPTFCHACNICPANFDIEMEGVTCAVRLLEWASAEVQRNGAPS